MSQKCKTAAIKLAGVPPNHKKITKGQTTRYTMCYNFVFMPTTYLSNFGSSSDNTSFLCTVYMIIFAVFYLQGAAVSSTQMKLSDV